MGVLYDITPPVSPRLRVFPGDTPLSREVLMDMARGDALTLSTLRATVHLGAHVDAPSHYGVDGRTIDRQPLDLYLGECQVVHLNVARGELIRVSHFEKRVAPPRSEISELRSEIPDLRFEMRSPRLLLRTGTFPDPHEWHEDFAAFEPETVDWLHAQGVRLVGIDTPSVDPPTAKMLRAHHRFLAHDMAILEGIVLDDVPEGMYELIALPLKLVGFDASPVRAVLRTEDA